MKDVAYLILNENGIKALRKTQPSLDSKELAVRVKVQVPDSAFTSVHAEAELAIAEKHLIQPRIDIRLPENDE